MSDTTIDEIFAEFGRKCSPVATLKNVDNPLVRREYIEQAKSALYDLMLEVIGEDEKLKPDENGKYNLMRLTEHQLRAEMRSKLREMFG